MSSVKEKIEQFKSQKGIENFDDYLWTTFLKFLEIPYCPYYEGPELSKDPNLYYYKGPAIGEVIGNIWQDYSKKFLYGLDIDFSTTNEEELLDIIENFDIFPYTWNNFKNSSNDVKWEILKKKKVDKVDSDFFDEELINRVLNYIGVLEYIRGLGIDDSKVFDFGKAIFFCDHIVDSLLEMYCPVFRELPSEVITKERTIKLDNYLGGFIYGHHALPENLFNSRIGMEYLCESDGRWLEKAATKIITVDMFQKAMQHDESKQPNLDKLNIYSIIDKQVLEYICSLDGRKLRSVHSSVITRDLIKIAMENGFTLDDVSSSYNLHKSQEGMEYICSLDGRKLRYADPITEKLIEIAMGHEDNSKKADLSTLSIEYIENIELLKYMCFKDGRIFEYISPKLQTNMELFSVALESPNPYIPSGSVLAKLYQRYGHIDVEMRDKVISMVEKCIIDGKYNFEQLESMIRGEVNQEFIRSNIFQTILTIFIEKYDVDYEHAMYCLDIASTTNDEITKTLNFEFLQKKYIPLYYSVNDGYQKLFVLARYSEVQEAIIDFVNHKIEGNVVGEELENKRVSLLSNLLNASVTKVSDSKEERWVPYYATIISSLSTHTDLYDNLIKSGEPLTKKDYYTLANYILGKHSFEINNLEDLRNYDAIREDYINDILNNPNSDFESLKNAVLEKMYGMSLTMATELWKPYSDGVLSSPKDYTEEQVVFFKSLSKIINQDNPDVLRQTAINFEHDKTLDEHQVIMMKTELKRQLTKMYNDTLYKVEGKTVFEKIDGIEVYKAAGENGDLEFNLSIHVLGAYLSRMNFDEEDFNYSNDWNVPKEKNHGICTSYVGNNYLGMATNGYSVLGFTDYGDTSMHLSAPYDVNSMNEAFDLTVEEIGNDITKRSRFMPPKQMIDYTRQAHNEIVFDRLENGSKKQPSYVIFFCDEYDVVKKRYDELVNISKEKIVTLNRDSIEKLMGELEAKLGVSMSYYEREDLTSFYETLEAAKDFGDIPIVVVEREKVAENEHKKIFGDTEEYKGYLAMFRDETNLSREAIQQYYHDIIVEFENNYAGNDTQFQDHENIQNKYFGDEQRDQIIEAISNKIRSIKDLETVNMMLEELEKVIEQEHSKSRTYSSPFINQLGEKIIKLTLEYEDRKQSSLGVETRISNKVKLNNNEPRYVLNFLKGKIGDDAYLNEYNQYALSYPNQIVMSEVVSMIGEDLKGKITSTISTMYEKGLYEDREQSVHSAKHIEDVILFAGLIGKNVGLDSHEMDLLMDAAMYHDVGMVNDGNEEHALASANIALSKLRGKYGAEDLGIVVAAIAYHEKDDAKDVKGKKTHSNLDRICQKIGLDTNNLELMNRVRRIADCLKDANALDRTRFLADTPDFTNPNYLRYDSSTTLIQVAAQLNESYAVKDIEEASRKSEQVRVMLEESLLSTNSPKETMILYRNGYLTNDNVVKTKTYGTEESYGGK